MLLLMLLLILLLMLLLILSLLSDQTVHCNLILSPMLVRRCFCAGVMETGGRRIMRKKRKKKKKKCMTMQYNA